LPSLSYCQPVLPAMQGLHRPVERPAATSVVML